mgnify:FL=1
MKTYESKEITIKQKSIKSISCDQCKKEIKIVGEYGNKEGVDLQIGAGYGSRFDFFLSNCESREYDLCDDCCEKLLNLLEYR